MRNRFSISVMFAILISIFLVSPSTGLAAEVERLNDFQLDDSAVKEEAGIVCWSVDGKKPIIDSQEGPIFFLSVPRNDSEYADASRRLSSGKNKRLFFSSNNWGVDNFDPTNTDSNKVAASEGIVAGIGDIPATNQKKDIPFGPEMLEVARAMGPGSSNIACSFSGNKAQGSGKQRNSVAARQGRPNLDKGQKFSNTENPFVNWRDARKGNIPIGPGASAEIKGWRFFNPW